VRRHCTTCGQPVEEDSLIVCPRPQCKGTLISSEAKGIVLAPAQASEIAAQVWRRLLKKVFGIGSALTVFSLISLGVLYVKALKRVETMLANRIASEFETDRIRATVQEVAKTQASDLMEKQISPIIESFKKEMQAIAEMAKPPTLSPLAPIVTKTGTAYKVDLPFLPSKKRLLEGQVDLQARIIDNPNARILDFWPDGIFESGPDSKRITSDGRAARLIFGPLSPGVFSVQLHTSGSCVVEIVGNHSLPKFQVHVR